MVYPALLESSMPTLLQCPHDRLPSSALALLGATDQHISPPPFQNPIVFTSLAGDALLAVLACFRAILATRKAESSARPGVLRRAAPQSETGNGRKTSATAMVPRTVN